MAGATAQRADAPLIPLVTDLVPLGINLEAAPCIPTSLPSLATPARTVLGPLLSAAFAPNPDGLSGPHEIEYLRFFRIGPIDGPSGRSPPSAWLASS